MLGWIENRRPRLPVSGEAAAIADLDQTFRQLGAEARHLPPDDSRRVRCLNLVTEAESSLPLARGYVSRARRVLADATDVGDRLVGGWEVNP
jgi:hypothetical protein